MPGKTVVYVVVDRWANSRVKALAMLADASTEVVFVTSRAESNTAPNPSLVVPYWPNPLGVLRFVGLERLKAALDSLLFFPSRHVLYVWPVVRALQVRIADDLENGRSVVVLTCAPAHALCLAGLRLKAAFPQIRWVIDWQDLWTLDEMYVERIPKRYRLRASRLERALVLGCDANVTTNAFAARALEAEHGVDPRAVTAIPHHFDVTANAPVGAGRTHRIVFVGGFFKPRKVSGEKFLEALRRVRAMGVDAELHLYGKQGEALHRFLARADEFGLVYHGVIPRSAVDAALRAYDYQLLLLDDRPNNTLIMHLKLPDYLATGLPILAIVPRESAVADIVRTTGSGYVVPADADWATGLLDVWHTGPSRRPERNAVEIARFAWSNIANAWRAVLGLDRSVTSGAPETTRDRAHA